MKDQRINGSDKTKAGYKEGVVSILVNTGLFIIKLWIGIVSGSVALIADAWHTVTDSLSSVMVIAGARLASKKPDKKHPFGHGRWEPITALFIGFLLSVIAFNFLWESIIRFRNQQTPDFGTWAYIITFVSLVVKAALAWYAFRMGKRTGNLSIVADGWHHQADAITSAVILAGLFLSGKFWWIDSVLGGFVSFMLFYAVYEIFKGSINKILGESPDPDLIQKIESIIEKSYPQGIRPHHYHLHNYIDHQELTFHIKIDDNMNIYSGHLIATDIENKISEELNVTATIHIEPNSHRHASD